MAFNITGSISISDVRDGMDGMNGTDGTRGPGSWTIGVTALTDVDTDAEITSVFNADANTPSSAVVDDVVHFYTGTLSAPTDGIAYIATSATTWSEVTSVQAASGVFGTLTAATINLDRINNIEFASGADGNIGLGENALDSVTSGSGFRNISMGYNAGTNVTSGDDNVLIGTNAAGVLTTGGRNIAIGNRALGSGAISTTGGSNVAMGYESLHELTDGDFNTSIGPLSGQEVTTGNDNVFVGREAGDTVTTGSDNVAIGFRAGANVTTGGGNVFIGENADAGSILAENNTSSNNVVIGHDSQLVSMSPSGGLTFIGYYDNPPQTTLPSGLGDSALRTSLFSYITIPVNSGQANWSTTSLANVASVTIDPLAYRNPTSKLQSQDASIALSGATTDHKLRLYFGTNTTNYYEWDITSIQTASDNYIFTVSNGAATGTISSVSTGNNIRWALYEEVSKEDVTNTTVIGHGAVNTLANNQVVLGNSSVTSIGGHVTFSNLSDERDKTDIADIPVGLDLINQLRPKEFRLNPRDRYAEDGVLNQKDYEAAVNANDELSYGFIAQEVLEDMESLSIDSLGYSLIETRNPNHYLIRPSELIPVLVKAVQELSAKVDELSQSPESP